VTSPYGLFHSQKAAACASLSKTNNVKEPVKTPEPQPENLTAEPLQSETIRLEGARFLVKPNLPVNHFVQPQTEPTKMETSAASKSPTLSPSNENLRSSAVG